MRGGGGKRSLEGVVVVGGGDVVGGLLGSADVDHVKRMIMEVNDSLSRSRPMLNQGWEVAFGRRHCAPGKVPVVGR